ncbi:MAG: multi-sensor hybrid histidine kinase [Fibrobacteres bacterium]|nr:multi-sensor hybrid histidine kinase [Fibrobacterota bacterium]
MEAATESGYLELRAELESTQQKLREAESTLDAIRSGKVDALVVSSRPGQDEIRAIMDMGSLGDSVFNQVAQPIFILDDGYRILRANQPGQGLCGFNPAGRSFLDTVRFHSANEGEEPEVMDLLGNWIPEGKHISGLGVRYDHPRLGTRFYLLDANPVSLTWEGVQGGIVTLMDITTRKLSELRLSVKSEQLQHQFDLLKSVSDNIAEGLILVDMDGKIIFQNPAMLEFLGVREEDFLGQDLHEVFRIEPESADIPVIAADPANRAGQEIVTQAGKLMARDGRGTPVQFSYYPVKDGNKVRGSIVVVSDISERVASERQLRLSVEKQQHSQKMEAIGRLAGGIAHDFNNLLLAILGFTDLSLALIEPGTPIHDNLVEVKKAGEKAAALTGQLLAYSRKQILAPTIRRVDESIEDLRKMIGHLIGEKITLQADLAPEPLWVEVDQSKLQQVLVNLVLNARDAMPGGGKLSIRTGRLDIQSHDVSGLVGEVLREAEEGMPPGSYACIEIEDTGTGMSGAVLEHLFEPFFTTKDFGKGSGLGLSTAFGIIRQMGGYMQVFSEESRGSLFKVILPLRSPASVSDAVPTSKPADLHDGLGRLIMLVEDEGVVRRLLAKVLKDNGYQVIEAKNGEDALANLPERDTDLALVVTDLLMDGMGGIELAERLANLRPGVEILFMSGYAEDHHKLPLIGGESPHFAAKPFRPVDFLAKVRSIMEPAAQSPRS